MSIAVDIVIMGLIVLVPDSANKQVTVLVPDITQPYYASDGTEIPVHRPLLVYDCAATALGKCGPGDQPMPAFGNLFDSWSNLVPDLNTHGARSLDGYQIELLNTVAPSTIDYKTSEIADLGCAAPDAAKVDPNFLAKVAQLKPSFASLLAARTVLPAAYVAPTGWVATHNINWQFAPLLDPSSRTCNPTAISEMTVITTEVTGTEALVKLSSLRGAAGSETITLEKDANDRVKIYITNMAFCPKWVVKIGATKRTCIEKTDAHFGSPHFEAYYEFSANRPPARLRPVPVISGPSPMANADDRPICPQGQLKP